MDWSPELRGVTDRRIARVRRDLPPRLSGEKVRRLGFRERMANRSVRSKLATVVVTATVLVMSVGVAGLHGFGKVTGDKDADVRVTDVQLSLAHADAEKNGVEAAPWIWCSLVRVRSA